VSRLADKQEVVEVISEASWSLWCFP
jgi:hypothetical protein